ncbi:acetyl-CoA carboxylase carboxyltransferase subunit alpha [Solihabitans fulvus]|uniref:Multifunctional fusion protein n=1 Tax=Solihabitans fulvus TaxID=1892852 RepID=A0A5B2WJY3_9PSEU|nr:acetyl-CoA carboxylase carboxyltransferase subunit alpha [Solihabitans fulvus]KAA2251228.1 acetyl-CoA carboxylase carboxyltransferase subunit alpha [Solihabitans fulvus]
MSHTLDATVATETVWQGCQRCGALIFQKRFVRDQRVCSECGWHGQLTAPQRIELLFDAGSVTPLPTPRFALVTPGFADTQPYPRRFDRAVDQTGLTEAVVCVSGTINGNPVIAAVMDFRFLAGSLGSATGELITLAAERALADRVPLLIVTASGGARMQEGLYSLMQMAKTSQALAALDEAGILTLSLITDPTYGGVAASFATLTDVIIAEPAARMGFAGRRVIEQTVRQKLPKGFQTAEFLLKRGLIDDIQPRSTLRATLARLLSVARQRKQDTDLPHVGPLITDPDRLANRAAWDHVRLARHTERPATSDYLHHALDGFYELRGDRAGEDCSAIVGGFGWLHGQPLVVIGTEKGRTMQERVSRNFGMASPAGYRKAARLMRVAAKLRLPIVTLIDTPGAYPGVIAEEQGQAIAIAENLRLMSTLRVPVVAVITGEGGSGGALALAVANRVYALENAVYSVISPEGCAAILWKTAEEAPRAAAALRVAAHELLRDGFVDGVIPEPAGGSHTDHPTRAAALLRASVGAALRELLELSPDELVEDRRVRFRGYGPITRDQLEAADD